MNGELNSHLKWWVAFNQWVIGGNSWVPFQGLILILPNFKGLYSKGEVISPN